MLFCVLLLFLTLGSASAQITDDVLVNDNSQDMCLDDDVLVNDNLDDEVLASDNSDDVANSSGEKSFDELEKIIIDSQDNSTINLNYDYKYDGLDNFTGIVVDKNNLTINGNGHVIDANSGNNSVRIFNITGSNVILKNLIFTNANSDSFLNGGAIYNTGAYLSVVNSTFINNSANFYGGAIYNYASCLSVADSTFINNSVTRYGGAIYNANSKSSVVNSTFIGNTGGLYGGAINNYGSNFSVIDSIFINNSAKNGGAIRGYGDYLSILRSIFINNTGNEAFGGSIRNYGKYLSVLDSIFVNNSAKRGGAIYNYGVGSAIMNSSFVNNHAIFDGGVIYNDGANVSIMNSSFVNNSATRYGGVIYTEATGFSIVASSFVDNVANNGSVIYTCGLVNASGNWWGDNNPNWSDLVDGNVIHDVYGVLNLTVDIESGVIQVNMYKNGTSDIMDLCSRDVKLIIKDDIINGELINGSFKTNYQFPVGTYNISAVVDNQVVNSTIYVAKIDTYLNGTDLIMFYHDGSKFIVQLLDLNKNVIANATVLITIHNVTYNRTTDANGFVYLTINLNSGNYPVFVKFNGNDTYEACSINKTVFVNSTIIADDIVKMYGNETYFIANVISTDGKALANTNITFNINGVFYTRPTDDNGSVKLNINLRPGNYVLTVYNNVTGEVKGFNITVNSLINSNDLTKYYKNESQFIVKIYGKDGKIAQNQNITFNVNGVLYTKTTNDTGDAKLNINLRPGNYTITTIYEGLSIGNNICVLPTLITSDLTMNYLDNSKFNATILDGQGNKLANQEVKFNVNGVFYNKITNNDGIASLDINLIAGEYIITSYYGDYETSNKITIKG